MISVVLCTYNGEKYISRQLTSVINQTYRNFEIIVSDDASTDNTLFKIDEILSKSSVQYHILESSKNLGYIKNFEKGILHAKGDHIALCDQDDVWSPNKLEVLISEIEEASLVYSDSSLIDESGEKKGFFLSDHFNMVSGKDCRKLILNNSISAHSMLFKSSLKKKILPLPDELFHDWWIAFVAMNENGIKYVEDPLVSYRIHSNNATEIKRVVDVQPRTKKKKTNKKWDFFKNLDQHIELLSLFQNRKVMDTQAEVFVSTYKELLTKRKDQLFSLKYFWFLLNHYQVLLEVRKASEFKKIKFALRSIMGLWVKKKYYRLNKKI